MAKNLVKKTKRLYRQIKEGPTWAEKEKARKKKKKDWASKYNKSTRDVIKRMRKRHVSDVDIKDILGLS